MSLSAASFIAISVTTWRPRSLGMVAAIAILLLLTLVIGAPAMVGVIYLLRNGRGRAPNVGRRVP
jgi:hypothetical protein